MMLPALGKAGASIASIEGVHILQQNRVGVYETTTIAATDPEALPRWLEANGFALTPGSQPVIEQYAREGWVFVAAKVQRETRTNGLSTPHPLSFTFPADKPVYPMRLTGVGNEALAVELYVFGPERAEAPSFTVEECQAPDWPEREKWWNSSSQLAIRHPLLREWAAHAPIATKLTARLTPAEMQKDVLIDWKPFKARHAALYSHGGALRTALNTAVPLFVGFILALAALWRWRGRPMSDLTKRALPAALFTIVLTLAYYAILPKISVRLETLSGIRSRHALRDLPHYLEALIPADQSITIAALRQAYQKIPREDLENGHWNFLLGGPLQEEDSPGNFTLRETADGIEFIGHDVLGGEQVLQVFPAAGRD